MVNRLVFRIVPYLLVHGIVMDIVGPVFQAVLFSYVLVFVVSAGMTCFGKMLVDPSLELSSAGVAYFHLNLIISVGIAVGILLVPCF